MFLSIILMAALLAAAPCQAGAQPEAPPAEISRVETKQVEEKPVVSKHRLTLGKKEIDYSATAGYLPITGESGETEARIFYVAYVVEAKQDKRRPLLFVFNGGPGSSAVWLHLGTIGPKRVQMRPDGTMPPPPYRLVDNEHTWLEEADMVFIDPVGTGYSRATKPDLAKKFANVQGDMESVGKFIRLYLGRYERWDSPLFLVGESYGAFRAAGLANYLLEHGIAMNGTMLISAIMNMQTVSFDQGNDLPYALYLPSYAATAWYHKKGPAATADLDALLEEAETWAGSAYLTALARGDRLPLQERKEVAAHLARFTGLAPSLIESRNLRIDSRTFVRELLRDRQQVTGTMDSRFTAANTESSSPHGFDPTVASIRPPYTALFNDYIRKELGFRSDLEYFILGGGIGRWEWEAKNSYADTSSDLSEAMTKNPHMKLFVAMGCFDLATPHFSTEYTISHLGLTPELQKNITSHRYQGGHMMYLDLAALARLSQDAIAFIRGASGAP